MKRGLLLLIAVFYFTALIQVQAKTDRELILEINPIEQSCNEFSFTNLNEDTIQVVASGKKCEAAYFYTAQDLNDDQKTDLVYFFKQDNHNSRGITFYKGPGLWDKLLLANRAGDRERPEPEEIGVAFGDVQRAMTDNDNAVRLIKSLSHIALESLFSQSDILLMQKQTTERQRLSCFNNDFRWQKPSLSKEVVKITTKNGKKQ
jgi:hypothetical protein